MTDDTIAIPTPDHVTLEFEPAGLGSRFFAHLVDLILIGLIMVTVLLGMVLLGLGGEGLLDSLDGGGLAASWVTAMFIAIAFAVLWGYYVLFEGLGRGQTPGKRMVGLRVLRDDGGPVGLTEAALRNLVRAADMLPPPAYFLGGIVMHFDHHGRRLGDMAAGTIVVRERLDLATASAAGAAWAARIERGESRQVLTLPRGSVGAAQVELIERFLARRQGLPAAQRLTLAARLVEPLLPLLVEDPEAWSRRADLDLERERLLEQVVAMARGAAAVAPEPAATSAATLY